MSEKGGKLAGMRLFLEKRARSFRYAGQGIRFLLRTQHNARIHLAATVVVVALGWALRLSPGDWALLVVAMMAVWVAEGLNTAVEALADAISTEHHPALGHAKDVAAGAVLLSAIAAVVIGLLVLGPACLAALHRPG